MQYRSGPGALRLQDYSFNTLINNVYWLRLRCPFRSAARPGAKDLLNPVSPESQVWARVTSSVFFHVTITLTDTGPPASPERPSASAEASRWRAGLFFVSWCLRGYLNSYATDIIISLTIQHLCDSLKIITYLILIFPQR